jgi:tryptophan-rich sensory protein
MASLIEKATQDMFAVRDGNHHFKLLYDGQCPICSREICALKRRNHQNKVHFIDINSPEFALLNLGKIDYKTAMTQIHAIDNRGNILVGLEAFAAVYANCKMPIISTLLHIRFIRLILTPFYKLFARSRTLLRKKDNEKGLKNGTKRRRVWGWFLLFILICLTVEIIGGYWAKNSVSTWYPTLIKPSWTPPDWVFGPVWSLLYLMIALSGWLIFRAERSRKRDIALMLYATQLGLNFIWTFLFFSLESPILGLIDITLLSLLILLTIIYSWQVKALASVLLTPYFIWVIYATTLNAAIVFLNR